MKILNAYGEHLLELSNEEEGSEKQKEIELRITALRPAIKMCNSASFHLQGKWISVTSADATSTNLAGTLAVTKERSKQRNSAATTTSNSFCSRHYPFTTLGQQRSLWFSYSQRAWEKLPLSNCNLWGWSSCNPESAQVQYSSKSNTPSYK